MVNCVDGEHEIKRTGEFTRLVSEMHLYKERFKLPGFYKKECLCLIRTIHYVGKYAG